MIRRDNQAIPSVRVDSNAFIIQPKLKLPSGDLEQHSRKAITQDNLHLTIPAQFKGCTLKAQCIGILCEQ